MRGNGLWGPIWGYIGLSEDLKTVVGAVFDHKSETPGLGAEITTEKYQSQYKNKPLDQKFDAIAGATRTSKGVEEMIESTLKTYIPYLKKQ